MIMRQALQIALKDLRRFSVLIFTITFACGISTFAWYMQGTATAYLGALGLFGRFGPVSIPQALFLALVIFALIPMVMQEDSATSSNAFWLTRPFSKGSIALGKVLLIVVISGIIPAVAMLIPMLTFGLPVLAIPGVVAEIVLASLVLVMPAVVLAASTRTIPGYIAAVIGLMILASAFQLAFVGLSFGSLLFKGIPDAASYGASLGASASGLVLASLLIILASAYLLVRKYVIRTSMEILFLLCGTFMVSTLVTFLWPLNILPRYTVMEEVLPELGTVQVRAASAAVRKSLSREAGDERTYYSFRYEFEAPPGFLVRSASQLNVALKGKSGRISPEGFQRPYPEIDICLSPQELLGVLDIRDPDRTSIARGFRCTEGTWTSGSNSWNEWLKAQSAIDIEGEGVFDIYSIRPEFGFRDLAHRESTPLPNRQLSLAIEAMNPNAPIVLQDVVTPFFSPSRILPYIIPTDNYQWGASPSLPTGYSGGTSSDALLLYSVTELENGSKKVEPLSARSWPLNINPFWSHSLATRIVWRSSVPREQHDAAGAESRPQVKRLIGIKLSKVGSVRAPVTGVNVPLTLLED